jgi:hypothetical protein
MLSALDGARGCSSCDLPSSSEKDCASTVDHSLLFGFAIIRCFPHFLYDVLAESKHGVPSLPESYVSKVLARSPRAAKRRFYLVACNAFHHAESDYESA